MPLFPGASNTASSKVTHLFASNVLQVFLHHDLSQPGFNLTLSQLSFCGPAEKQQDTKIRCVTLLPGNILGKRSREVLCVSELDVK